MIETTHLAPDSRKHTRVRAPIVVEWGTHRLDVVDWSPGGVRVTAPPEGLTALAEAPLRVSVVVEDTWVSFTAEAKVERLGDNAAALSFVGLSASGGEVLHAVAEAAQSGVPPRLAAVIERVDPAVVSIRGAGNPGAPASVPPKPVPGREEPPGAWRPPLRMIAYIALGLLLAIYLGRAFYQRVWRIEVDTASLVAPTARIVSPADGVLRELHVQPGDRVAEGASVFLVESPAVQAALDRAALELGQAEARVAELEAVREAEARRLSLHDRMLRSRYGTQRLQVSLLEERLAFEDARVERIGALVGTGVSEIDLDQARGSRASLAGQLAQARTLLSTEAARLRAAKAGFHADGDRIDDGLPEADAALTAARAELDLRRRLHTTQIARAQEARTGQAPFAGRVAQVEQTAGTPVRQGDLVVVLEQEDALSVEAWVTRHQAEYLRIGAPARVYVAGLARDYDATVRSVEAHPGASARLAEVGEGPRLQVMLDLQGYAGEPETLADMRADLRAIDAVGLPVVVSFERSWR